MRSLKLYSALLFITILLFSVNTYGQLAGVNTINPSGGNYGSNPLGVSGKNYTSFTNAISALSSYGVTGGPVTFNVTSGTYPEQITVPYISTASATNTITFQSVANDSISVTLQYGSSNYVVRYYGCSYVTFRKMTISNYYGSTYSTTVWYNGNTSYIGYYNQVKNCRLLATSTSSVSTNTAVVYVDGSYYFQHCTIANNYILNGAYGIYFYSYTTGSSTEGYNAMTGNYISNPYYCGIYTYGQYTMNIRNNTINTTSTYFYYGIYSNYGYYYCAIDYNTIISTNSTYGTCYGIYKYYDYYYDTCNFNKVTISNPYTIYGIFIEYNYYGFIANNNTINATNTNSSTSYYVYGMYVYYNYNAPITCSYNTVNVTGYYGLYGMDMYYNYYGTTFNYNNISITCGYGYVFGFYDYYNYGQSGYGIHTAIGNTVKLGGTGTSSTYYGFYELYDYGYGTGAGSTIFANNMVTSTVPYQTYGIMDEYNYYYYSLYNSVYLSGSYTSSYAYYTYESSNSYYYFYNNTCIANGGYTAYVYPPAILGYDYNDLYTTGSNFGYNGSSTPANFAAWRGSFLGGQNDLNSINFMPSFNSTTDLHITNAGITNAPMIAGLPFTGTPSVTTDIDLDPRGNPSCMGADEIPVSVINSWPAKVSSITTLQPNTTTAGSNSINNPVILIQLKLIGGANPLHARQIIVNSNGTTNLSDITNLKLWWTGNNATFSATTQFGSTIPSPLASDTFAGTQVMANGANYFWLTYDLPSTATSCNYIDAQCTSVSYDSAGGTLMKTRTPGVISPAGNRMIYNQLSGVYTINPLGSGCRNFTSFTNAVNVMCGTGLAGPTIFNVTSGTYNEQFTIPSVPNTSATNTVTFQSVANDSVSVILTNAPATNNYIIQFNGCSYITFRKMKIVNTATTYSRVIDFTNGSSNDQVSNCWLVGYNIFTQSADQYAVVYSNGSTLMTGNKILNNFIQYGSIGINYLGYSYSNTTGNIIQGNIIKDFAYYGIYVTQQYGVKVKNNYISSISPNVTYGIYPYYCWYNCAISNNSIRALNSSTTTYGIYPYYCEYADTIANDSIFIAGGGQKAGIYGYYCYNGIQYINNYIDVNNNSNSTTYGIYDYYSYNNTTGYIHSIKNNWIILRGMATTTSYGIYTYYSYGLSTYNTGANSDIIANNFVSQINGQFQTYGIYEYESGYAYLAHNSVNITGISGVSDAIYVYNASYPLYIYNNIFNNTGNGLAMEVGSYSQIPACNYNVYYTVAPPLNKYSATYYNTLALWMNLWSSNDQYSLSQPTTFVSSTNLHLPTTLPASLLYQFGTPVSMVTTDIDNQARSTVTPFVGADEITGNMRFAVLNGVRNNTTNVTPNTTGNEVIGVQIFMSGNTPQLSVTAVNLSTAGTTNLADITNAKLYYTGASRFFAATTPYGSAIATPGAAMSFTASAGTQYMLPGYNYFWLSYDVPSTATCFDNINAQVVSVSFDSSGTGSTRYPAISNPAGTRMIIGSGCPLNGVYTINPTATSAPRNFVSFTAAKTALTTYGINGACTFNVAAGTYTEQLTFPAITGTSASNTITFQSAANDSVSVTLQYAPTVSTSNYVVQYNGVNYMTFRKMKILNYATTYTIVFDFLNSSSNDQLSNCQLIGQSVAQTSQQYDVVNSLGATNMINNKILNNFVQFGSFGIYYIGNSSATTTGNVIQGNVVRDPYYYGIYVTNENGVQIKYNNVSSVSYQFLYGIYGSALNTSSLLQYNAIRSNNSTNSTYGFYLSSCVTGLDVSYDTIIIGGLSAKYGIYTISCTSGSQYNNNYIDITSSNNSQYGISDNSCSGMSTRVHAIQNNKIILRGMTTSVSYGLYMSSSFGAGTLANSNIVANNCISQLNGTAQTYGIYDVSNYYTYFIYNSVNLTGVNISNYCYWMQQSTSTGTYYYNNIGICNLGYCVYMNGSPSAVLGFDYNDFYTSGTNFGYNGSATLASFTAWVGSFLAASNDLHSQNLTNIFTGPTNLSTSNLSLKAGLYVAYELTDIAGVTRSTTSPTIGAYEITGTTMKFVSATTLQNNLNLVALNSTNNDIISIPIVVTGNLSPISATQFNMNTTGSSNTADIANAKMYYTGTSPVFSSATQYGTTITGPSGSMIFTGSQALVNGTNYFWLTYDVTAGATVNDLLDAQCTSITTDSARAPSVTNPTGSRAISGPMSGVYTINPAGSGIRNFTSFTQAVNAMVLLTVNGAVTFNVSPATYTEQVTIPAITGASATNTILFQSTSNDSTKVTLTYALATTAANYTLKLNAASYITFRKITISNTNATFSRVLEMTNLANYDKFLNNRLIGYVISSNSDQYAVIHSDGTGSAAAICQYDTFRYNNILNGSMGVCFHGYSGTLATNNDFEYNNIGNWYYYGIYSQYQTAAKIQNNQITSAIAGAYYGIYLNTYNNSCYINSNTLNLTGTGINYGIYIINSSGSDQMNNNIINMPGATGAATGIYTSSCYTTLQFNNNTINVIAATAGIVTGISFNFGGTGVQINNNTVTVPNSTGTTYGLYMANCTAGNSIQMNNNNVVLAGTGAKYGIYVTSAYYGLTFNKNTLDITSTNNSQYGFYFSSLLYDYSGVVSQAVGNKIYLRGANSSLNYGIYYASSYSNSGATQRTLIANNFIMQANGTGQTYGIYSNNSGYTDVLFNNISIAGINASSYGLYFYASSNTATSMNNRVRNNAISMTGNGYAIYISSPTITTYTPVYTCNYNDLYTTGTNLGYWGTSNITNLATWKTQSLTYSPFYYDSNSISVNPAFTSTYDLHTTLLALYGTGSVMTSVVSTDIDGQTRSVIAPCIGADEFFVVITDAGISGFTPTVVAPGCPGSNAVTATVSNYGTATLTSVTLNWKTNWNGSTNTSAQSSLSIPTNGTQSFSLGNITFNFGDTLYVWTTLPNGITDAQSSNDLYKNRVPLKFSGTVTIGGTNPKYSTITAALADLNTLGVCGPTSFLVRQGTYTGNYTFTKITGASLTNTITFRPDPANTFPVTLTYTAAGAADNYVIWFKKASYITFKKMNIINANTTGFGIVLNYSDTNMYVIMDSNKIYGRLGATTAAADYVISHGTGTANWATFCTLSNNTIKYGSYGIYIYGNTTNSAEKGNVILNNLIDSFYYYGIYAAYQDSLQVKGNTIRDIGTYTGGTVYGIYAYYDYYYTNISGNQLILRCPANNYGIDVYYNSYSAPIAGRRTNVNNNFISIINGTGSNYGLYIYYPYYINAFFNTINITSGTVNSTYDIYCYVPNSYILPFYGYVNVRNNVAINSAYGYAVYLYDNYPITNMFNYNDYYTNGAYIGQYNSNNLINLTNWIIASAKDTNSISIPVTFYSATDLRHANPSLRAGQSGWGVTTDFYGTTRAVTPTLGAYEYPVSTYDAGITAITSPAMPACPGSNPVTVNLMNYGSTTLTADTIRWMVNGVVQTPYIWSGSLVKGSVTPVTIGNYTFAAGINNVVKVFVSRHMNGTLTDQSTANDTAFIYNMRMGLAGGTYTINPSLPYSATNFVSFTDAITTMQKSGLCGGPVVFNVATGTYVEQLTIMNIPGLNTINNITFQSAANDSSKVILTYALATTTNNYTVNLNGVNYITFRKMTISNTNASFSRVVVLTNNASYNNFLNDQLIGIVIASNSDQYAVVYAYNTQCQYNVFKYDRILYGSIGVDFYGVSTAITTYDYNNVVNNSYIRDFYYYGVYSYYQNALSVSYDSIISNISAAYAGVYLVNVYNVSTINNNYIYLPYSTSATYGIYTSSCYNYLQMNYNTIIIGASTTTVYGIYMSTDYYSTQVYNNFIDLTTSSSVYGIYLTSCYYGAQLNNNTVNVTSSSSAQYGIYAYYMDYENGGTKATIVGNKLSLKGLNASSVNYGLYYYYSCGQTLRNLVANNFISQSNGTVQTYGIYHYYSGLTDYEYNSVNLTGISASSIGMYFYAPSYSTSYIEAILKNNISFVFAGYPIQINGASMTTYSPVSYANYNDYYTPMGTNLGQWAGTNCINMSQWKGYSLMDANSLNINPGFKTVYDLHLTSTALDAGTIVPEVTNDIDGDPRAFYTPLPYIGADEYVAPVLYKTISTTIQPDTTNVTPASTNNQIIGVRIYTSGDSKFERVTQLTFNTTGTTNPSSDVTNAKVYYTGNNGMFSPINLYGTVSSPNGVFSVTGSQYLDTGVVYFWLSYDAASGATINDYLDAQCTLVRLDSGGIALTKVPVVTNPAGARRITNNKVLNNIVFNQASTAEVYPGTTNNPILRLDLTVTGTTGTLTMDTLRVTSNNTNDNDIAYVKLFSTTTPVFSSATQIGTTQTLLSGKAVFTGLPSLTAGMTYIWVTYDIASSATWFDYADAQISAYDIKVGGRRIPFTVQNPAGSCFINQPPNTLPYIQDFETSLNPMTYTANASPINGSMLKGISYQSVNNFGRLTMNALPSTLYDHTIPGQYSATMDAAIQGNLGFGNLIGTLNLTNYTTSTNLTMSFWFMLTNYQSRISPEDGGVWVRGNNNAPWVYVYDMNANRAANMVWKNATINISSALAAAGQVVSSTFQFRFSVRTTYQYNGATTEGITLDDINITGTPPMPNDAGVISMTLPTIPFSPGSKPVQAVIKNFGNNNLTSAQVNVIANGVLQSPVNWTGNLAPGQTAVVTLNNFTFPTLYSTLKIFTKNPNGVSDPNPLNDTLIQITGAGLTGTFTIGGLPTPNFPGIIDAVNYMTTYGVSGPVTFNIRPGIYNSQININPFPGYLMNYPIIFQSQSGDSTSVIITSSIATSTTNFTLQLNGVSYITFKKVTINNTNTTYSRVVALANSANYNSFINNIFIGLVTTGTSDQYAVVYSLGTASTTAQCQYDTFRNNKIMNGSMGIEFEGYSSSPPVANGNDFENNNIINPYYYGMYMYYLIGSKIKNNYITINSNSAVYGIYANYYYSSLMNNNTLNLYGTGISGGIYMLNCNYTVLVNNNNINITSAASPYAIYQSSCSNYNQTNGNVITMGSPSSPYGMYLSSCSSYNQYLNNVINITSAATGTIYGIYASSCSTFTFFNNNTVYVPFATGTTYGMNLTSCSTNDQANNNIITLAGSGAKYGLLVSTYQNGNTLNGNTLDINSSNSTQAGLYITNMFPDANNIRGQVIKNKVLLRGVTTSTSYGIYYYTSYGNSSTVSLRNIVANNFIAQANGTCPTYGIYSYNSGYTEFLFNNISIAGTNASSYGLYFYTSSNTTTYMNSRAMDNISFMTGGGYSIAVASAAIASYSPLLRCNYNDLYTNGSYFGYLGASSITTFALWKTTIAGTNYYDSNSINLNPFYKSAYDLHVGQSALKNAGFFIPLTVTDDIDGDIRSTTTPCIGADEFNVYPNDAGIIAFTPNASSPGCSGTNTVTATVFNYGTTTLSSVTINWKRNYNGSSSNNAWTGLSIPTMASQVITIGSMTLNAGDTLYIWTTLPNGITDVNTGNDLYRDKVPLMLSGTIYVGGLNCRYLNIASAVNDLNTYGVCGPVTFLIRQGLYPNNFVINSVTGLSAANRITFRPDPANTKPVMITYAPTTTTTDNYVIKFNGCSYITIKKLTLMNLGNVTGGGTVLDFVGINRNIIIDSNNLYGRNLTATSTTATDAVIYENTSTSDLQMYDVISNNTIKYDAYGIYMYGASYSAGYEESGNLVYNNLIDSFDYMGISAYYQGSPQIIGNTIRGRGLYSTEYGIYAYYCDSAMSISQNYIKLLGTSYSYGIYMGYCNYGYSTITTRGLLSNNMITIIAGTSTNYGIYDYYSMYHNIYFNSVNIISGSATSYCYYLYNASYTTYNYIKNNIFMSMCPGYAIFIYDLTPANVQCNYNDLFTFGTNLGNYNNGTSYTSLATWQAGTSYDINSFNIIPPFLSPIDLRHYNTVLRAGATGLGINVDIYNSPRLTPPMIGAFEPMPYDVGIQAFYNPSVPYCDGYQAVIAQLRNFGTTITTLDTIKWSVNGVMQPLYVWSGSLAGGTIANVTLGYYTFVYTNNYTLKAWTSYVNGTNKDMNHLNDTILQVNVIPDVRPHASFILGSLPSDTAKCLRGNIFNMTNTSTSANGVYIPYWNFGDGTNSYVTSPSQVYTVPGNYTLKLIVSSPNGCVDSTWKIVHVWPHPATNFTELVDSNQCIKTNSFTFNNTTTIGMGGSFTNKWYLGTGATSTSYSPVYSYIGVGTYIVKLVTTSNYQCKDSIVRYAHVRANPTAGFNISSATQCYGHYPTLNNFGFSSTSNISTGTFTNLWNFGDGQNSALISPSHTYLKDTTTSYNVKLISISDWGCKDSITKVVNEITSSAPDFSINTPSQCVTGNSYSFTNNSTIPQGSFTSFWKYGNGTTSATYNPVYSYPSWGNYNVTLINTTNLGCKDSIIKIANVRPLPVPGFTINNANQCLNGNLFNYTSTTIIPQGTFSNYWDFGNGNNFSGLDASQSYSLVQPYSVKLVSTSNFGCKDSLTKTINLRPSPSSGFSINTPAQCLNGNVFDFTNNSTLSSGTFTNYWQFGDGGTNFTSSPSYTYPISGNFDVKLITTTAIYGCKDSITKSVNVYPSPATSFSINTLAQCLDKNNYLFTNNSTISMGSFTSLWKFGDNTSEYLLSPLHVYTASDTFQVKLILTSFFGCQDSLIKDVYVLPKPNSGFTVNNPYQCFKGNLFNFTNTSTIKWGTLSYHWNLGDGNTSINTNVSHSYSAVGIDTVTMIANSAFGCVDSTVMVNYVKRNPYVDLGPDVKLTYLQTITLDAGSGMDAYLWSNNKTTSTITVKFNEVGLGSKVFWVTVDSNGCNTTDSIKITFTTSINSVAGDLDIQVYPNPAGPELNVAIKGISEEVTLILTDINGKIVRTMKAKPDGKNIMEKIDISNLAAGLYYLNMSNDNINRVVKFMKY